MGEFVGPDAGLGYLLLIANGQLDTPLDVRWPGPMLSVMGIALFALICALERITPGHLREPNEAKNMAGVTLEDELERKVPVKRKYTRQK